MCVHETDIPYVLELSERAQVKLSWCFSDGKKYRRIATKRYIARINGANRRRIPSKTGRSGLRAIRRSSKTSSMRGCIRSILSSSLVRRHFEGNTLWPLSISTLTVRLMPDKTATFMVLGHFVVTLRTTVVIFLSFRCAHG